MMAPATPEQHENGGAMPRRFTIQSSIIPTIQTMEMIMSDHPYDAVTLLVTLDMPSLCRAARLGGLPIALDEQPLDEPNGSLELLRLFARRGILAAIHDSFDRHYPTYYPDDVEVGHNSGSATGHFSHIWRGRAKW